MRVYPPVAEVTVGVLTMFSEIESADCSILDGLAPSAIVKVDQRGQVFFQEGNELDILLDPGTFRTPGFFLMWLDYLSDCGLVKERASEELVGVEQAYHNGIPSGLDVQELVEIAGDLRFPDIMDDIAVGAAAVAAEFFKRYPWLRVWRDDRGHIYELETMVSLRFNRNTDLEKELAHGDEEAEEAEEARGEEAGEAERSEADQGDRRPDREDEP